jgi:hypothetical protein
MLWAASVFAAPPRASLSIGNRRTPTKFKSVDVNELETSPENAAGTDAGADVTSA